MNEEVCKLYDYYEPLLTKKQQTYFKEYHFENLTLTELSEIYNISRNAIHKNIKETIIKLQEYENKLKLYQKQQAIKNIIQNLDDETKSNIEKYI